MHHNVMRGFINCVKFCNTGSTDPCLPGTLAPPPGPPWSPAPPQASSQSLGELETKQDNVVTKRISILSSHKSDQFIVHHSVIFGSDRSSIKCPFVCPFVQSKLV